MKESRRVTVYSLVGTRGFHLFVTLSETKGPALFHEFRKCEMVPYGILRYRCAHSHTFPASLRDTA